VHDFEAPSSGARVVSGGTYALFGAAVRHLRRLSTLVVTGVILVAVLGPYLAPHDPISTSADVLASPSLSHLMGTDEFGRDIFSRLLHAARRDLYIALLATAIALSIGSVFGAISGYTSSKLDMVMMRTMDVVQSFPMFVLALALVGMVFSPGERALIIVISVINVPVFARLMRLEILARKSLAYVEAARCAGSSSIRILFYHLYPNGLGPVLAAGSLTLAWAILDVAALSYLGVGIRPPSPEWGVMLSEGAPFILSGEWWPSFFPGLAIALAVFGFNFLGDELQDRIDPRRSVMIRG
jgi:peptide/nickel transport system permease protein